MRWWTRTAGCNSIIHYHRWWCTGRGDRIILICFSVPRTKEPWVRLRWWQQHFCRHFFENIKKNQTNSKSKAKRVYVYTTNTWSELTSIRWDPSVLRGLFCGYFCQRHHRSPQWGRRTAPPSPFMYAHTHIRTHTANKGHCHSASYPPLFLPTTRAQSVRQNEPARAQAKCAEGLRRVRVCFVCVCCWVFWMNAACSPYVQGCVKANYNIYLLHIGI